MDTPRFKKILVPVDFGPLNAAAIETAAWTAGKSGGRITLLHVIEKVEHLPDESLQAFYTSLEAKAGVKMQALASGLPSALLEGGEIVFGHRAREIVRFAAGHGVDLIVLSSHRFEPQGGLQALSTVSHEVAMLAPCPVLLVKGAARG